MITLYRAMCTEEATDTLRHQIPSFLRRYKFFSPSLQFVQGRVQDGQFNNSRFKPTRYTHLLEFRISAVDAQWFDRGRREWKLDRHCAHNVHWLEINKMEQFWWDKYKVDVPKGRIGDWAIERFEITEDGAKLYNFLTTIQGFGYRSVRPGSYTRLTHRGQLVMSDTRAEIRDHLEIIRRAEGKVLLNGLGLGLVLRACLLKPEVSHVTVIEIALEVINLVEPHLRKQFGDRFTIYEADALTWKAPEHSRWNVVWHDIFDAICADNLVDMTRLKRRYGRRCDWQGCWAEYEHRTNRWR